MVLGSHFALSDDFKGIVMFFDASFCMSLPIQSNYGVIGHLSLLNNPVMRLSQAQSDQCYEDLKRLKARVNEGAHLFHEELVSHLLIAHILDLYDIHAKSKGAEVLNERSAKMITRFIELLYAGEYKQNRTLEYYAQKLFVSPHYLSEVCRRACGKGATYLIERFTIIEIARLLVQKELNITQIADEMNFSSVSYFTRYVQKRLGLSPSAYRKKFN